MRATEFITELFQPGQDWQWEFRGSEEAIAQFTVGDVEYRFTAYEDFQKPGNWEIEFKINSDQPETRGKKYGITGTGNAAQVISTVTDIMREFLKLYSADLEGITFTAKEPSRKRLYTSMVQRLLPGWRISKDSTGTEFTVSPPLNFNKPAAELTEINAPGSGYELEWDDQFGPKEIHARAHDRQGKYIDINFVPVRDNVTDIEFSKMDNFELTGQGDEIAVFSTVIDAVRRYLSGYQPKIIVFSGKGEKRAGLYQRLINRLASQFGYQQFDINKLSTAARQQIGATGSNVFVLRKKSNTAEVTEYKTFNSLSSKSSVDAGEMYKKDFKVVKTPLDGEYRVRYNYSSPYHEYYIYDIKTDESLGSFSIDDSLDEFNDVVYNKLAQILKPGVKAVSPHIALADAARGTGLAAKCYQTFLSGGNWVFTTKSHSVAAGKLWDRLGQLPGLVSIQYDIKTQQVVDAATNTSWRLLGPTNRFNLAPSR